MNEERNISNSFVGSLGETVTVCQAKWTVNSSDTNRGPSICYPCRWHAAATFPESLFALDVHDDEDDMDNLCELFNARTRPTHTHRTSVKGILFYNPRIHYASLVKSLKVDFVLFI